MTLNKDKKWNKLLYKAYGIIFELVSFVIDPFLHYVAWHQFQKNLWEISCTLHVGLGWVLFFLAFYAILPPSTPTQPPPPPHHKKKIISYAYWSNISSLTRSLWIFCKQQHLGVNSSLQHTWDLQGFVYILGHLITWVVGTFF